MQTPRLIACDVDGTLLRLGTKELSDELISLIRRIVDCGIVFMPASGREYSGLRQLFAPVERPLPIVANNGALAVVDDAVVLRQTMDDTLARELIHAILADPECEVLISGVDTCYTQTTNEAYLTHLRETLHFNVVNVPDATRIGEPYSKISAYYANLQPNAAFWEETFGARCHVVVSGPDWVDAMPFNVNKAAGVDAVCKKLGILPQECIAFGDAPNDCEMLTFVGRSYAVESAAPEVQALSTQAINRVEDVLAQIVDNV